MATREASSEPGPPAGGTIDPSMARLWLEQMLLIRRFEERPRSCTA
jgi:hypothetical protein